MVKKIKKAKKEIFISLNKNMHNGDLEALTDILMLLNRLKVDGVFYYDVAVLQIHHRLSLDFSLIWSAEHFVTNQYTIQYWKKFGISAAFLSNEITKEEILQIQKNCNLPCIVQVFGYLPMYVSKRKAIQNYLTHFSLQTNTSKFYLWKEEKKYPILERKIGTEIYSSFVLNAIEEYLEYQQQGIMYALVSGCFLSEDQFQNVLSCFRDVRKENVEEMKEKIQKMIPNTGLGFLYKETIYQVKKNEK